jgi:hypothetical protein
MIKKFIIVPQRQFLTINKNRIWMETSNSKVSRGISLILVKFIIFSSMTAKEFNKLQIYAATTIPI